MDRSDPSDASDPATAPTNAATSAATATNAPAAATNAAANAAAATNAAASDEVQLSLMGAPVEMVVQWLAQNTGKTVIKSPKVQCMLMITSSKKLAKREAISLVYRALAIEGFTATETANAIYITPEGQEPKLSPELLDAGRKDIPDGRQRLVKIFTLRHIQPAELKEKVRAVLSDKGVIECDDLAKQVIVTDYNDNLRFLAELIKEFDVPASDLAIQIYVLKHTDAEEVGNLIGMILNGATGAAAKPPSGGGGGGGEGGGGGGGGPSPSSPGGEGPMSMSVRMASSGPRGAPVTS